MKKYKKSIVILANQKSDSYLKPLVETLEGQAIKCRVVVSRFEIDLLLITHNVDYLVISENYKPNKAQTMALWAQKKHNIPSLFFNENNTVDVPDVNDPSKFGVNYLDHIKSEILSDYKLKSDNALFSKKLYNKLNLTHNKINHDFDNFKLFSYEDIEQQGYVLVEAEKKSDMQFIRDSLQENIVAQYDIGKKIIAHFDNKYIGSSHSKTRANIYGFEATHPEFDFKEKNGKIEVPPNQCSDKIKNKFNIYIKLKSRNSDYLFVVKNKHLTSKKLHSLINKQINIRVDKKDQQQLETYLQLAHIVNNVDITH